MSRFDTWFEWLMMWEGRAFEDDPDDRGGATKFGIDQRSHPDVDIRALTETQAKEIYRTEYWGRVRADELPPKVGEVVADIAVNNGVTRAAKWLQEASGAAPDGVIGPRTITAARRLNPETLALALVHRREIFYRSIASGRQAKYLRGWMNRNRSLEAEFVEGRMA